VNLASVADKPTNANATQTSQWTRPRFTDNDPVGNRIPNAVERLASVSVSYRRTTGWFGGARLRYLGPATLIITDYAVYQALPR
jgi:hypothetical protein